MANLLISQKDHAGDKALSSFYSDLIQRVDALPGVQQTAIANVLPLDGNVVTTGLFHIVGQALPVSGKPPAGMSNGLSQGYFKALGMSILRGRQFDSRDVGKPTAIIDAALARKYFHNTNPIGHQIRFGDKESIKFNIEGVVPSIKYVKLSKPNTPTIYIDNGPYPARSETLAIHAAMSPSALINPVQKLFAGLDPNVAVYNVRTMKEQLADSLRDKQTTMTLLLAFGGIALALAIVGVYAVMSYAVGQRRAECGIRLALGAQPGDLQWLVLKDGLKLLVIGLILGLGLAVAFGYLLSSQLFGVAPFDPVTLIGSAVVLCVITLTACYFPARRAAKIDPAIAIMEQ